MNTAGTSNTVLEMGAEITDPALWAAMQLTKPDQKVATVGEAIDLTRRIFRQALDMDRRNTARGRPHNSRPYTVDVITSLRGAETYVVRDERGRVVNGTQFKGRRSECRVRDLCGRLNEAFAFGFDTCMEQPDLPPAKGDA